MRLRLSVLIISLLSLATSTVAQVYPVSGSVQLIGPHSIFLGDYTQEKSEDVIVNLTFNDPVEPTWDVRLRLTILNDGVPILTSADGFLPAPITLTQFSTETFTGFDLAQYFYINNLREVGGFDYRGQLPEGFNQFRFEVLDYNNPAVVLSAPLTAGGYFILNDPPLLQLPMDETEVTYSETQNILFSWLPLHLGSPNPITDVEYEFTLVQMQGLNKFDAVNSAMPIYQTRVTEPNLFYTDGEPLLEQGVDYAWRVQVVPSEGVVDPGFQYRFANQGYSQVSSFTYGVEFVPIEISQEECNSVCQTAVPTNASLRNDLQIDDVVRVGQFEMTIAEITAQNGEFYTGTGSVWVPLLLSNLAVSFSDLTVNTDDVVFGGNVYTATESIVPESMTSSSSSEMSLSADEAAALEAYVRDNGRQVSDITSYTTSLGLPLAIDKTIGGIEYNIIFTGIHFDVDAAYLTAAFSIEDPESGQRAIFGGKGLCVQPYGVGGVGSSQLYLMEDFDLGEYAEIPLVFKAPDGDNAGTYISFNCEGFEEMSIEAEVEFSKQLLIPSEETEESVKATFNITTTEWGQFIGSVSMNDFEVNGVDGYGFTVQEAYIDYSTVENIEDINFPEDYDSTTTDVDWKGFYLKRIAMTLPEDLVGSSSSLAISGTDIIIDNSGFSGYIAGENILELDEGTLGDWAFSIDEVGVTIVSNSFSEGGLNGTINLPITDTSGALSYEALISKGDSALNMQFNISAAEDIAVDLWAATFTLASSSVIAVEKTGDGFTPYTNLNGDISVALDLGKGGDPFEFSAIAFEGFKINHPDEEARIACDALSLFGLESEDEEEGGDDEEEEEEAPESLSGFPITLNAINFEGAGDEADLIVDLSLNLTGASGGGLAANSVMTITGKYDPSKAPFKAWEFKSYALNSLEVDADLGAIAISGSVNMFDSDETYGSGFKGMIEVSIEPAMTISSVIQFGKVDDYRYWYLDGQFVTQSGIGWAGVGIYGFGGGAYYHMRRQGVLEELDIQGESGEDNSAEPGVSLSGVRYIPDRSIALGLKAKLILGSHPSPNAFNGDVGFEIAFQNNGNSLGVQGIYFDAETYYMTPSIHERDEAQATGTLAAEYDFNNETFSAALTVDVNVANGTITGGGNAQMYVSSRENEWYVWIGTPTNEVSVNVAGVATFNCYFDMGTTVPDMPSISDRVPGYTGGTQSQRPSSQMLSNGGAIIFGGSYSMPRKEFKAGSFYAAAEFGVGFDVFLRKVQATDCPGARGGHVGIDDWYLSGQAYAYGKGEVGLKVKTWFYKGNVKILTLEAAMVLLADLPNPTWMFADVYVRYRILGGAIKGSVTMEFEIGQKCKVEEASPIDNIKVITDVAPSSNVRNVECYANPSFAFGVPINTSFSVTSTNSNGTVTKHYMPVIDNVTISGGSQGLTTTARPTNDKYGADVYISKLLDPYTWYTCTMTVKWKVKVGNGSWNWYREDGQVPTESKTTRFRTGPLPDFLPQEAVSITWPVRNARNWYRYGASWLPETMIITKQAGWGYLFSNAEYDYFIKVRNKTTNQSREASCGHVGLGNVDIIGSASNDLLNFVNNNRNGVFEVSVITRLKSSKRKNLQTERKEEQVKKNTKEEVNVSKSDVKRASKGNVSDDLIYTWNFKTSRFNHPYDKMSAMSGDRNTLSLSGNRLRQSFGMSNANQRECFDKIERDGYVGNGNVTFTINPQFSYQGVNWNRNHSTFIRDLEDQVFGKAHNYISRCGGGRLEFNFLSYFILNPMWRRDYPRYLARPSAPGRMNGIRWTNNRDWLTSGEINSGTPNSGVLNNRPTRLLEVEFAGLIQADALFRTFNRWGHISYHTYSKRTRRKNRVPYCSTRLYNEFRNWGVRYDANSVNGTRFRFKAPTGNNRNAIREISIRR